MSSDLSVYTNPSSWGLPTNGARVHPDRVVIPKKVPDAMTPTSFARVLQDTNQTPYALGLHARELSDDAVIYRPDCAHSGVQRGSGAGSKLHPTLGEVLPVDAEPKQSNRIITTRQQIQPATGRALDLYL